MARIFQFPPERMKPPTRAKIDWAIQKLSSLEVDCLAFVSSQDNVKKEDLVIFIDSVRDDLDRVLTVLESTKGDEE